MTSKETQLKIALWLIPCIFGAGGFFSMVSMSSSGLTERVEAVEVEVFSHSKMDAHPVTETRIDTLVTEQREIRAEQRDQGEAIAAICSATGARCP